MSLETVKINLDTAKIILLSDDTHIAKKMRSIFFLRNITTDESARILCEAFKSTSVLLKHEVAYVLGQMQIEETIPVLIKVLDDQNEDEIVRHEAGEALGNFPYRKDIAEALERNIQCSSIPVRETCYIARKKMQDSGSEISEFGSRDPAYPLQGVSFEEAKETFLDTTKDIYLRYKAMFYLRDLGTKEAIEVLGRGMEDRSSLFKHEISFICGQMANPHSIGFLVEAMGSEEEHGMVRHECAEALGIIGTKECLEALVKYQYSKCDILRESVEVAIDIHGYVNSNQGEYCEI
ncbi:Deoxyhypusine hydroxylase [Nosema granulosis]|uniref:Deoxyhypusine hydroxylase n=1 Tax=Nosema granulosis TaxID=83296 RepID=A0A9P6KZK7_9MICR|nr:Deoxyhypusine hydroxylase [Nosema granulosis]